MFSFFPLLLFSYSIVHYLPFLLLLFHFHLLLLSSLLPSSFSLFPALHFSGSKTKKKTEVEADGSKTKPEEHGLKSKTQAEADSSSIKMNGDKLRVTRARSDNDSRIRSEEEDVGRNVQRGLFMR